MAKVHVTLTYKTKFTWPEGKSSSEFNQKKFTWPDGKSSHDLNIQTKFTWPDLKSSSDHSIYSNKSNQIRLVILLSNTVTNKPIILNKMNCELMLTYDTPSLWQTGSRNLTGQKTLPTIWGTYMKLVTKYQISAINSCWEKCDEKWAYMFNVYKNQPSRQTGSRNLTGPTRWIVS
jgi:hypothetical protein